MIIITIIMATNINSAHAESILSTFDPLIYVILTMTLVKQRLLLFSLYI